MPNKWTRLNTLSFEEASEILQSRVRKGPVSAKLYDKFGNFVKSVKITGFNKKQSKSISVTNSFKKEWEWIDQYSYGYRLLAIQMEENTMQLLSILTIGDVNLEITKEQQDIIKNTKEGQALLSGEKVSVSLGKYLDADGELLALGNPSGITITQLPDNG